MSFKLPKEVSPEYAAYLESDHWREFKRNILRKRRTCKDCGIENQDAYKKYRQGLNVHHITYERIGKEKPEDVELLCHGCHMKRHGLGDWLAFVEKFKMPEVGKGSEQACSVCGVLNGRTYFNVDEDMPEWICVNCR